MLIYLTNVSVWPILPPKMYFLKNWNSISWRQPIYRCMEILRCMDMFLITKILVYILFNLVYKPYSVCICSACCSLIFRSTLNILRMCKKVCICNGRRSNQVDAQQIVNVYKIYLETRSCKNNSLVWEQTRYQRNVKHNTSNTGSLKHQVYMSIDYKYLVSVVHNSSF